MSAPSQPHFICIGSQKAGTGWVYDQFDAHADFVMPPMKELQFFNNRFLGEKKRERARFKLAALANHPQAGRDAEADRRFIERVLAASPADMETVDYYRAMFAELTDKRSGDVCPAYMKLDDARIRLMAEGLPDTKVFGIVRNPVSRAWSQARMRDRLSARKGTERPSATASAAAFEEFLGLPGVSSLSLIASYLARYKAILGDRLKLMFFDDLANEPERFRAELCAFLEVSPDGFDVPAGFNAKANRPGTRPMPDALKAVAVDYFAEEAPALADLLGGHAIRWAEELERERAALRRTAL